MKFAGLIVFIGCIACALPGTIRAQQLSDPPQFTREDFEKAAVNTTTPDCLKDSSDPFQSLMWNMTAPVMARILEDGADIETKGCKGETALRIAVEDGEVDVVQLLIKKGANVNTRDTNGWTPLIAAVYRADPDYWSERAVRKDIAIVKLLLAAGARVDVAGNPLLEGPTADYDVVTPLNLVTKKEPELKRILTAAAKAETDRSELGKKLLNAAVNKSDDTGPVIDLLNAGADIEAADVISGERALHIAAGLGLSSIVDVLIQRGADVEARDNSGESPLLKAVGQAPFFDDHRIAIDEDLATWDRKHLLVVKRLIAAGATVSSSALYYNHPLIWFASMEKNTGNMPDIEAVIIVAGLPVVELPPPPEGVN
jgi:ankyrin repeat protein